MTEDLAQLKCGDCLKCDNLGFGQYFCDETVLPVDPEQPACISILRKGQWIQEKTDAPDGI